MHFITQETFDALTAELAWRRGPLRHEILERLVAFREATSVREPEGGAGITTEMEENEVRITAVQRLLEDARVGAAYAEDDEVAPGKIVTVRFVAWDEEETFFFGLHEESAHISMEAYSPTSPIGAAINGHRVGDSATFVLANGTEVTVVVTAVDSRGDS